LPAINWFPPLAAFHLRDDEARVYTRVFERQSIAMVSGRDAQALRQLSKREILGVGRGTHSTVNRFVTTFPAGDDIIAVETALGVQYRETKMLPSEIEARVPEFGVAALRRDHVRAILQGGPSIFTEGLEYLKARLGRPAS